MAATSSPNGSVIYIFFYKINHFPHYWGDDAHIFNPDRWENLPETCTTNAYMIFSQGPRGCIGRKFAETEMKVLLCCLLAESEFAPVEGAVDAEREKMCRVVLQPKDGIRLRVTPLADSKA